MKTKIVSGWVVLTKWLNAFFGGSEDAAWAADTAIELGAIIIEDGKVLRAIVAGTTDSSEPTWPTSLDGTVVDNTVTWKYVADSDSPSWSALNYYGAGNIIFVTGNKAMRAIVAGTTGASAPVWPSTLRGTVADGTVTWEYFKGHQHDGLEVDGSSSKVLLTGAAEVTGTLPVANQAEHVHSGAGGQFAKIILSGAADVTGLLPVINIAGETYGFFNVVFADTEFNTEQSIVCFWRKSQPIADDVITVEISFPYLSAQAHASGKTFVAVGTPLPAGLIPNIPNYQLQMPIHAIDGGVVAKLGCVYIGYNGSISVGLYKTYSGDANSLIDAVPNDWATGAVAKGFYPFTIRYPVWQ